MLAPSYTCCDCETETPDARLIRVLDTCEHSDPIWRLYGCGNRFPHLEDVAHLSGAEGDPQPPVTLSP